MQTSTKPTRRGARASSSSRNEARLPGPDDCRNLAESHEFLSRPPSSQANLPTLFFPTITEMLSRTSLNRWDDFLPLYRAPPRVRWVKVLADIPPRPPVSKFLRLPQELLLAIVEKIDEPGTLYNLLRTHRKLYRIVIARLYRKLEFRDVHNYGRGELLGCLQIPRIEKNWGYWVQEINIGPTIGCARRISQTSQVWKFLLWTLRGIPDNQLKKLTINAPHTGTIAQQLHLISELTSRHRLTLRHITHGLYHSKVRELTLIVLEIMTAHGGDLFYNVESFRFLFSTPRVMSEVHIIFLGTFRLSGLTLQSTSTWPTRPHIPEGYPHSWLPSAPSIMVWLPQHQQYLRRLKLVNLTLPLIHTATRLRNMRYLIDLTFDGCELILDEGADQPDWDDHEATKGWILQFDTNFTSHSIRNVIIRGDRYGVARLLALFSFKKMTQLACIFEHTERARIPTYMRHVREKLEYFVLGLELERGEKRRVQKLAEVDEIFGMCPLHRRRAQGVGKRVCVYGYAKAELERTPSFWIREVTLCFHRTAVRVEEDE